MSTEKKGLKASFKSMDTEEFLDIYFNRPIGYAWALFFRHFDVHPNVVTILSILLGIGAGIMFYYPDLKHTFASFSSLFIAAGSVISMFLPVIIITPSYAFYVVFTHFLLL